MPTYEYQCPSNGRIVEVSHKMAERVATWGELCRRAGIPADGTPAGARVVRLISAGNILHSGSLGSRYERPCDSGACATPTGCGGGSCGFG